MKDQQQSADQALADEWAAALEEQQVVDSASTAPARFPELSAERQPETEGDIKLDAILDVPVTVSMEIGRARVSIRNLLQLNQGSVVELDRLAGEPMDVLVNGTLVAQGEVVVVNEKFGIRLTDIISPSERVKRLRA
jgi:flagellar motor switch protein FliN/FliY